MIIPVRCFTCNNMIGDKWNPYVKIVAKEKSKMSKQTVSDDIDIDYIEILLRDKFLLGKKGETVYIIKNE